MAEGNERALADKKIERQRGEREDEHARAEREQIDLRAEMRGEREQREPGEEEHSRLWGVARSSPDGEEA